MPTTMSISIELRHRGLRRRSRVSRAAAAAAMRATPTGRTITATAAIAAAATATTRSSGRDLSASRSSSRKKQGKITSRPKRYKKSCRGHGQRADRRTGDPGRPLHEGRAEHHLAVGGAVGSLGGDPGAVDHRLALQGALEPAAVQAPGARGGHRARSAGSSALRPRSP